MTFFKKLRVLVTQSLGWMAAVGGLSALTSSAADLLKTQPSAFLRSYVDNAVDWMVWGEAAFDRAKREQKPVLLVIGTFTSELSRAMHRQTFSNRETAAFINESFVCILVDAKEQPEVTALYRNYLQTVKQLSGFPMNLWLTPELKPFEGANYLPPTEEWGKEGFNTVAKRAAAGWASDPGAQRAKADEAVATVTAAAVPVPASMTAAEFNEHLELATEAWKARFDTANGGFGDPPKYPEPELLRYLLLDPATKEMALTTFRSLVNGAVRDPLDGGFFRYSADAEWRHPYFQKTLSDQARLALALLDAAKISNDPVFADAAVAALHYTLTQLRNTKGDFAAAEDATPETIAPSYFWTLAEIRDVIGDPAAKVFSATYSVTAAGNIPPDTIPGVDTAGKNLLYRAPSATSDPREPSLREAAAKLLAQRKKRPAPLRDDQATSGMHGLLLSALARTSAQVQDAALKTAADETFAYIQRELIRPDTTLLRLPGRTVPAAADDYASLIAGLRDYGAVAKSASAVALVESLSKQLTTRFWNASLGRYVATTLKPEAGIWAVVPAAAASAADLPSAEACVLLTLQGTTTAGEEAVLLPALQRAVAVEIRDAAEVARGDLLLALSTSLRP